MYSLIDITRNPKTACAVRKSAWGLQVNREKFWAGRGWCEKDCSREDPKNGPQLTFIICIMNRFFCWCKMIFLLLIIFFWWRWSSWSLSKFFNFFISRSITASAKVIIEILRSIFWSNKGSSPRISKWLDFDWIGEILVLKFRSKFVTKITGDNASRWPHW